MLDILLRAARLSGLSALGLFLLMPTASARAAATAVNTCQTLSAPGNYVVTSNLTASGDCFTLTVSNIAIDLQGHKIVGNGSGAAITDGGNSIRYIIVANGHPVTPGIEKQVPWVEGQSRAANSRSVVLCPQVDVM